MKIKHINKNNTAVAGVIEALLLVALAAVILSIIQYTYVPQIMDQKESEHMDTVANQFSNLKSVIDSQSLMGVLASDEALAYAPMSSSVTLGSKELPYFVSARSFGQIEIIDRYNTGNNIIDIEPPPIDFLNGIPLTSIKYSATNFYYLDGESLEYILEGGGIILQQIQGGAILVQPAISVSEIDSNTIEINYDIPLFKSIPGKNTTSGYQDCFIRTNYSKHYSHSDVDIDYIHIYTNYINAWYQSLINNDAGLLWEYYDNGIIDVKYDDPINPTCIEITPNPGKQINIEFTIIEIGIQTGPGIVYKK